MRIGLFGGTFDPPHVGHQIVAEAARDACDLDRVWWIPARRSPHKPATVLSPGADRLAMTRLATAGHARFVASDAELLRKGLSRTVDTVRSVLERHPEHAFFLVVGADNLAVFSEWVEPEAIARMVPLVVYPRPGAAVCDLPPWLEGRVRVLECPLLEVSATDIRRRVRDGRSIRYLVGDGVRAYVEREGLYRAGTRRV